MTKYKLAAPLRQSGRPLFELIGASMHLIILLPRLARGAQLFLQVIIKINV